MKNISDMIFLFCSAVIGIVVAIWVKRSTPMAKRRVENPTPPASPQNSAAGGDLGEIGKVIAESGFRNPIDGRPSDFPGGLR
jgi:hypothetical protein